MALFKCGECQGVVSSLAQRCPHCGAPKLMQTIQTIQTIPNNIVKGRPSFGKVAFYVGAAIFAFFYVILREPIISGSSNKEPILSKREIVLRDVKIGSTEKVDKFGFMNVSLSIGNPTDYKIKNIKIECTDKSNTYADLKTNKNTVYEYIGDHQQLRVNNLEMGMAHSQRSYTMCKMVDFDFSD